MSVSDSPTLWNELQWFPLEEKANIFLQVAENGLTLQKAQAMGQDRLFMGLLIKENPQEIDAIEFNCSKLNVFYLVDMLLVLGKKGLTDSKAKQLGVKEMISALFSWLGFAGRFKVISRSTKVDLFMLIGQFRFNLRDTNEQEMAEIYRRIIIDLSDLVEQLSGEDMIKIIEGIGQVISNETLPRENNSSILFDYLMAFLIRVNQISDRLTSKEKEIFFRTCFQMKGFSSDFHQWLRSPEELDLFQCMSSLFTLHPNS